MIVARAGYTFHNIEKSAFCYRSNNGLSLEIEVKLSDCLLKLKGPATERASDF